MKKVRERSRKKGKDVIYHSERPGHKTFNTREKVLGRDSNYGLTFKKKKVMVGF